MILISHRGNINGSLPRKENTPGYILEALSHGFDVEIDVWYIGHFFLGHDKPELYVDRDFLLKKGLWCHAKNIQAMIALKELGVFYFWHQRDKIALTSNNFLWTFPGEELTSSSIACLPEIKPFLNLNLAAGVCSDYIKNYL